MINFEDFKKVDLRIGKIIEVESVENSNKLLNLKVDIGEDVRQILSGIAKYYQKEDLIGKEVVVAINLEPREMMGLESQGMVLAATGKDNPILLIPEEEAGAGSKIT
jgi:methionine--tRNA ligase beta chain